jgi:hypothetical protein
MANARLTRTRLVAVAICLAFSVMVSASAHAASARSAGTSSGLTVVGGARSEQAVTLRRQLDGKLGGEVTLAIRSRHTGRIRVRYFPTGSVPPSDAGTVKLRGSRKAVSKKTTPLELLASLPANASPTNFMGVVELRLIRPGKAGGDPLELKVNGVGDPLAGVAIEPANVKFRSTSWWGPISQANSERTTIELRGPGVPGLLRQGFKTPTVEMLLHANDGRTVNASLDQFEATDDPAVVTALVTADGDLNPGKYSATLAISDLSAASPKLSVELQANHGFIWPLLAVLAGALIGGGIYLSSNLRRRKVLLRESVKNLLRRYKKKLRRLEGQKVDGKLPIWDLSDYLKDESGWYQVAWDALPELDGVKATWSSIYFARSDADLDEAARGVQELRAKVTRWLMAADSFSALTEVQHLNPVTATGDMLWSSTNTVRDTRSLLRRLREIEPADEESAKALCERLRRQARWHAALAHTWNMKGVLGRDISASTPGVYSDNDRKAYNGIDLETTDGAGTPEHTRSDDAQFALESKLDEIEATIKSTYKGDPRDLEPSGTQRAVLLGAMSAADADPGTVRDLLSEEPSGRIPASEVDTEEHPERMPATVAHVVWRDIGWSTAVALVTAAAYVPIFYGPTWGTLGDYGGAFAAGFLGKAVINWTALPLFQSLRPLATKPAGTKDTAEQAPSTSPDGASPTKSAVEEAGTKVVGTNP